MRVHQAWLTPAAALFFPAVFKRGVFLIYGVHGRTDDMNEIVVSEENKM